MKCGEARATLARPGGNVVVHDLAADHAGEATSAPDCGKQPCHPDGDHAAGDAEPTSSISRPSAAGPSGGGVAGSTFGGSTETDPTATGAGTGGAVGRRRSSSAPEAGYVDGHNVAVELAGP